MNSFTIKSAVKHLLGWGALAGGTVFFTLLFSFLGAISCAAMAGMMMGVSGRFRWQSMVTSMVFPSVVLGMTYWFKRDLFGPKLQLVAWMCWGSFWLVYVLTAGLIWMERGSRAAVHAGSGAVSLPLAGGDAGVKKEPVECSFAAVRYMPYEVTGEFVNIGVVVFCRETGQLEVKVGKLEERISSFFPEIELKEYREALAEWKEELRRAQLLLSNGHAASVKEDILAELLKPKRGGIRFGEMRYGLLRDAKVKADELYEVLVRRRELRRNDAMEPAAVG